MNIPDNAPRQNERNTLGLVGLILSALGLVICLLPLPGLVVSIIALRREPRTLAIIGTVLGVVGLLTYPLWLAILLPALANARESARHQTTQSYVNLLQLESEHHHTAKGTWPTSIDDLDSKGVIIRNDPWDNQIRFKGDGSSPPSISSAGPDGTHDTHDDLVPNESSYR